jgi:hypothetical protein
VVERLNDLPPGVLGFRLSRKLTRDEYQELIRPIYDALERGEKLSLYVELPGDFDGLDLGALWDDLKAAGSVGLEHRSSWQKMAVVTDKDWIRHGAAVFGPLAPGELRVFDLAEADQARAWVSEQPSA